MLCSAREEPEGLGRRPGGGARFSAAAVIKGGDRAKQP